MSDVMKPCASWDADYTRLWKESHRQQDKIRELRAERGQAQSRAKELETISDRKSEAVVEHMKHIATLKDDLARQTQIASDAQAELEKESFYARKQKALRIEQKKELTEIKALVRRAMEERTHLDCGPFWYTMDALAKKLK